MKHKKTEHNEKISICRNNGGCLYGDSCWFNHDTNIQQIEPTKVKCSMCDNLFDNIKNFMHHKKHEHGETVKKCDKGEKCHFGKLNCWFQHNEENIENEKQTQKLFSMMEKFTNRIIELEKQIKTANI